MRNMEDAIADEILAEVARSRVTAKAVQEATGISPGSWQNYFVQRTRHIPMPAFLSVCAVMRVLPEDMMRRARERAELPESETTRELMAGLRPFQRKEAQKVRSAHLRQPFGQESSDEVKRG
jgi:hypothetical protein